MTDAPPHAVVYFDVNKTVIMHDPVQGKGLAHILNDLLTERAFGRVVRDAGGDATWRWNGVSVLQNPAVEHADDEVSYGRFLRAEYPMSEDPAVAKKHKRLRKDKRQDFTSPGHAGEGLATEHRELLDTLQLPAVATGLSGDALASARAAAGLDDSPSCFLLPAFFTFVQFMHARGASFSLVFRTYGDDLARIAQEFNCFCEGRHPYFPSQWRMDGSDGGVDRRIHLDASSPEAASLGPRFGTFFRSDDVTALVMGTFAQPRGDSEQSMAFYEQLQAAPTSSSSSSIEVHTGLPAIHELLTRRWRAQQATLAIRDFYPFWFRQCEAASAGKLLTLDPTERLHALFFDDNILDDDAHIVDARDVRDGAPLAFVDGTKGVHLVRVEPLDVIRNDRFFVDRFLASAARAQEAQRLANALGFA